MREAIDAQFVCEEGLSMVKDDACSSCRSDADELNYGAFWKALQQTRCAQKIVLTVEGNPSVPAMSAGGMGNARRVGHDISPYWQSMVSLTDIGAGLWSYAHNASVSQFKTGFWNDLDMLEVGNAPEFVCGESEAALERCRYHFSLWAIAKAVLLIGNDMKTISNATLRVLKQRNAIAVNQDALGVAGRRVAVHPPRNQTLLHRRSFAVVRKCDATRPTQKWRLTPVGGGSRHERYAYLAPCNSSDPYQQWRLAGDRLRNVGADACFDPAASTDPASLANCSATPGQTQHWTYSAATHHIHSRDGKTCVDVYNFQSLGPIDVYPCKTPGSGDSNQRFTQLPAPGGSVLLTPDSNPGQCVRARLLAANLGALWTVDPTVNAPVCMSNDGAGFLEVRPCDPTRVHPIQEYFEFVDIATLQPCTSASELCTFGARANAQVGASGPVPHSRYLTRDAVGTEFHVDMRALAGSGARIRAADQFEIIDDDSVGGVTHGGEFCLDAVSGYSEVWAAPLVGGKVAVVVTNRSPGVETVTFTAAQVGASATAKYGLFDIWLDKWVDNWRDGAATLTVQPFAVRFVVLTPQ